MTSTAQTPLVSASQIETYRSCPRKWAWRYLMGIVTPQHPAAALGEAVDTGQLQPYFLRGEPFDYTRTDRAGYIAESARALLPPAGSAGRGGGLEVQRYFQMPSPSGMVGTTPKFGYQGYLDMFAESSVVIPRPEDAPLPYAPLVGDFKTTKDFRWRKKERDLLVDVQAQLYSMWAMLHTGARAVDLVWIYMRTDPAKAYKAERTYLRVDADHVVGQFQTIDATADEMFNVRVGCKGGKGDDETRAYVKTLPLNVNACSDYGGCPYQGECSLSPMEIVEAQASADAKRRRLPVVMPLAVATSIANQIPENKKGPNTMNAIEALRARKAATLGQAPPAAAPSVMGVSDTAVPAADPTKVPAPFAVPINPPESLLPPAAAVGIAAPPPPAPAQAPTEAPKRRGRPPKAPEQAPPAPVLNAARPIGLGQVIVYEGPTPQIIKVFEIEFAAETYSTPFGEFTVGPYAAKYSVRPGEDTTQARERVSCELSRLLSEELDMCLSLAKEAA